MKLQPVFTVSVLTSFPAVMAAFTFTDWQAAHFTPAQLSDPAVSGATVDPDGDGLANLQEYVFFGQALTADSNLSPTLEDVDGTLALTYRKRHDLTDVDVRLQGSDTLENWITYNNPDEVARAAFANYDEVTLLDPGSSFESYTGRRFLRLRLELSPSSALRAPVQTSIKAITPTAWRLSWTDLNSAETGYAVERREAANTWVRLMSFGPDTGGWTHATADYLDGTAYRVVAIGAGSETLSSPVVLPDNDEDGIPDALELGTAYTGVVGTFPTQANLFSSNGTGISDGWAPRYRFTGAPAAAADSDSDGVNDVTEAQNGLNPFLGDTDGDGRTDAWELANGYDPLERHSAYMLFRTGFAPLAWGIGARVMLLGDWTRPQAWDSGALRNLTIPTSLYSSATIRLGSFFWYINNSYQFSACTIGGDGVAAAEGEDLLLHDSWSGETDQSHQIIVVWPSAHGEGSYTIRGTPLFDNSYVSEGFNARWSSAATLMQVDLIGRVWAKINTSFTNSAVRAYSGPATFTDYYILPTENSSGFLVLQSNGSTEIGYVNDYPTGLTGAFVGKPRAADLVDFCPLALNLRGDVLGENRPFSHNLAHLYSERNRRVLEAERYGVEVLQQRLGAPATAAFVRLAGGTRVNLPTSVSVVTGFDNEANVYGREVGGRAVIWAADPSKLGLPPGTPAYTAVAYKSPVLPTGLKSLVDVSPGAPRADLVRVARESSGMLVGNDGYVILPAGLAVDYNRDGVIKTNAEDETDSTSAKRMFRFWSNDDDDELFDQSVPLLYEELSEDDRIVTSATEDWKDDSPDCARDLEDFARLQVYIGGLHEAVRSGQIIIGVKWGSITRANPSIRLHRHAESTGGTGYLFNTDAVTAQLNLSANEGIVQVVEGTNYLVSGTDVVRLPSRWFSTLSEQNPRLNLLFEGGQVGTGELRLVLLKKEGENYVEIGEGPGVWLDIQKPNEFVERFSCGDDHLGDVVAVHRQSSSATFAAPTKDEEKDYVLYVHGYNMDEFEKQRWIETTYKRLYWLGYKGRVGGFTWPCSQSFHPFDGSEERAWSSATELKTHLQNLKARGYRVHVLAHSQGNVVMSEALRQAGPGAALATTYIATQAAVAASAYHPNALQMPNPGNDTPDVYTVYPPTTRPYFDTVDMSGAASRYVNFYNRNDYALSSTSGNLVSWEKDQELKPNIGYHWSVTNGFFKGLVPFETSYAFPADRFNIFSFCAEAKSLALGTIPTGGAFTGFTNMASSYGYGTHHIYHSAQFRASMAERYQYWDGLLTHLGIPSLAP